MEAFAKILYEQFFLRDALGKIAPGALTILAAIAVLSPKFWGHILSLNNEEFAGPFLFVFYVLVISICWTVGLALQVVGEIIGLHSASSRPMGIFLIFGKKCKRRNLAALRYQRCRKQLIYQNLACNKDFKSNVERLVVLREASGNFALALLCASIFFLIDNRCLISLALLAGGVLLLYSHYLHAAREAIFEIGTLLNGKLITERRARVMFELIPKCFGESWLICNR